MLNSLPVLFPSTVLASAAQKLDVRGKTLQGFAVLHSLLLLSSDRFALLPCTVLAGDARKHCIDDEKERRKVCALHVCRLEVAVHC